MNRRPTLTQSMSGLHTWAGLLIGWVLYAIFLSGTLAVFDREINWWMQPEFRDRGVDQVRAAQHAQRWLEDKHAGAPNWSITLPTERAPLLSVSAGERRRGGGQVLDAETGEPVKARDTVGGNFFFRFHYTLHMPRDIGVWAVGFAGMAMLVALVSGVIIHKKIFKDFFTFRPGKGQRSWLDGHNASGVLLLPFHLMITYTGLVIFFTIYMPAAMDAFYGGDRVAMLRDGREAAVEQVDERGEDEARKGERLRGAEGQRLERGHRTAAPRLDMLPLERFIERAEAHYGRGMIAGLSVSNPGRHGAQVTVRPLLGSRIELTKGEGIVFDAATGALVQAPSPSRATLLTQRVMAGLHFAQFGGYPMRWIYFVCGLVSCVMIATGLVLYTVKKRKQAAASPTGRRFLRVVEGLNVAAVAGLTVACIALLWANRLLPVTLAERTGWELRIFFGIWSLSLIHGWLRPPRKAWREQFGGAAVLCMALPAVGGGLVGEAADPIRFGLEACVVVTGVLLAWLARSVSCAPAPLVRDRSTGGALSEVCK